MDMMQGIVEKICTSSEGIPQPMAVSLLAIGTYQVAKHLGSFVKGKMPVKYREKTHKKPFQ